MEYLLKQLPLLELMSVSLDGLAKLNDWKINMMTASYQKSKTNSIYWGRFH